MLYLMQGRAVKNLLRYRLPSEDAAAAKAEWYSIVEGQHPLWNGVSEPYKHMIRAFLVHFQMQILSHSTEQFNFLNGSVGEQVLGGGRAVTKCRRCCLAGLGFGCCHLGIVVGLPMYVVAASGTAPPQALLFAGD
jgi:hypothetical protein